MQTANHEYLKHVIYVSRPTHFDHTVLDNILMTSRPNNLEVGVTGNLICHADLFLQMLEGPSRTVHRLYEKIRADDRHADIVKLRDEKSERKLFPSWAMRNDSHQSWMLSRSEITKMTAEEALILFEHLAREINKKRSKISQFDRAEASQQVHNLKFMNILFFKEIRMLSKNTSLDIVSV